MKKSLLLFTILTVWAVACNVSTDTAAPPARPAAPVEPLAFPHATEPADPALSPERATPSPPGDAAEPAAFDTDAQRMSYALGVQVGKGIRDAGLGLDLDLLTRGIRDTVDGKDPALDPHAVRQALGQFQHALRTHQHQLQQELSEKNLAEGKAFLAENAKKDGVTVLPSGLQYEVLREGTGRTPSASDRVRVHFRGASITGEEFDNSYSKGEPMEFRVDRNLKGWVEALQLMQEGAKWRLFLPPDLAYALRGKPPKVGPNAALLYEIELLEILEEKEHESGREE